jgi:hypothetical protein
MPFVALNRPLHPRPIKRYGSRTDTKYEYGRNPVGTGFAGMRHEPLELL